MHLSFELTSKGFKSSEVQIKLKVFLECCVRVFLIVVIAEFVSIEEGKRLVIYV